MNVRDTVALDRLETPFLAIDLTLVERNIDAMQRYCNAHGLALRPHVKTHKMPEIARLQLQAGAVGLTCQKLGEAELFADRSCGTDLLVTFPLVGVGKAERFASLATRIDLAVAADSLEVATGLSAALVARSATAGFLVECDTGYRRTGVQSPQDAADLAEAVDSLPGLVLRGLMTHPSHADSGPWLAEASKMIRKRGLQVSCVSGGGTPNARNTHEIGGITELRVGTYVYGDRRSVAYGALRIEDCALCVQATVVSTPTRSRAIVDAGSKTLTSDLGLPVHGETYGELAGHPGAIVYALSEEHGHVDMNACRRPLEIGEIVSVIPNHACGTVNLHDEAVLHRGGADAEVMPIAGRGLVR